MTNKVTRVVDAHIHIWDPARTDWYPYLSHPPENGPGDTSRMYRRFDVETYRSESAAWNVEKFINVAAATGRYSVNETLELDRDAGSNGGPQAIVGGLPPTDTPDEAVELLDKQMQASRFRGVRKMGPLDAPLPQPEVLRAMEERSLTLDLMTHPDKLEFAAAGLAPFEGLSVVVEHTGWPRSGSKEEFDLWKAGMAALASIGENVTCKLSGLAMPLGTMDAEVLGPWIEYAVEVFGVDRCMFASNFPVDATAGSFDSLYTTFSEVTAGFDDESREKLFASNAERVYRC
jgi:L-fuconolactonase